MEIHKPKAVHSWREFLIEIATIVVGILIALSLEQAVEKGREAQARREAIEEVRAEVALDLATIDVRRAEQACIDKRLQEIHALLDAASSGKPFQPARWIGQPTTGPIFTFRLQSASQSGRASLFTSEEQEVYSGVYFPLGVALEHAVMEQVSWAHLQGLIGLQTMSPDMILNLRQALGEAEYENTRIKVVTTRAAENAGRLRITAAAQAPNRALKSTCRPMFDPPSGAR